MMKPNWQQQQAMQEQMRQQQQRSRQQAIDAQQAQHSRVVQQSMQEQMRQRQQRSRQQAIEWQKEQQRKAQQRDAEQQLLHLYKPFFQIETKVASLRTAYATGQVTEQELQSRLTQLVVQDKVGVWWTVDLNTLEWLRHDGTTWVPGTPPHTAWRSSALNVASASDDHRGCGWPLILLLLIGAAIVVVVAGVYSTRVLDLIMLMFLT